MSRRRSLPFHPLVVATILISGVVALTLLWMILSNNLDSLNVWQNLGIYVVTVIVGVISNVLASYLDRRSNNTELRDFFITTVREGIRNVSKKNANSDWINIIEEADQEIILVRPYTALNSQLPSQEIEKALTRGVNVTIIYPSKGNTYIKERLTYYDHANSEQIAQLIKNQNNDVLRLEGDLKNIRDRLAIKEAQGTLLVKKFKGPFVLNIVGNEKETSLGIPWSHQFACHGPQINLVNTGDMWVTVKKHYLHVISKSEECSNLSYSPKSKEPIEPIIASVAPAPPPPAGIPTLDIPPPQRPA